MGTKMDIVFSQKKKETLFQPWIEELVATYQEKTSSVKAEVGPKIKVSQTLSSLAILYEKIRNAVDFRAEHLFRRNAIERILRRRWMGNKEGKKIAAGLVKELIWGRYLANDTIPQKKIVQTGEIIDKYLAAKRYLPPADHDWLLGIASAEIDEALVNQKEKKAWVAATVAWFEHYYSWKDNLSPQEKKILLYIAVHRALIKSDEAIINYHLLTLLYPQWKNHSQAKEKIVPHLKTIKAQLSAWINHPLGNHLFRWVKKTTPPFLILKDLFEETPPDQLIPLLRQTSQLDQAISRICALRYQETRTKVKRGITRSIIYIFATKMLFALLLEIPVDLWYYQKNIPPSANLFSLKTLRFFNLFPLFVNLVFPPFLMFFIGFLIHTPDEENTKRIIEKIHSFVYPITSEKNSFSLARRGKKNLWEKIFGFIYLVAFITIFLFLYLFLKKIGFNPVNSAVFFFFVCLVLLFGFRVRWAAQELVVTDQKENLGETIINFLSLPFLDVGFKLSAGLAKLNFLVFILDFLIEAPLKSIIEAIGEWAHLVRKKQEEVVEVPFQ